MSRNSLYRSVKAFSPGEETLKVDTSAYADGDVVGGLLNLNALCSSGAGGILTQLLLVDDAAQSAVFKLYLFDGVPTTIADQAAFAASITAADLGMVVDVLDIASGDYVTLNSNVYALIKSLRVTHGTGELWGYLVINGSTPTFATEDDLQLKLTALVA